MAARAGFLVNQVKVHLFHGMVAMAGDAGGSALAKCAAMGASEEIGLDADMAASAKVGNGSILGRTEEAAAWIHGIGGIPRVAAMAVMAGNAVLGMDAPLPEPNRLHESAALDTVALDTDGLAFRRTGQGRDQQNQHRDDYNPTVKNSLL